MNADNKSSFSERINYHNCHNQMLVWTRGDYESIRVVSALSYEPTDEEEVIEQFAICDVFGDGDGTEWWNDPMTDDEFKALIDCTIFRR